MKRLHLLSILLLASLAARAQQQTVAGSGTLVLNQPSTPSQAAELTRFDLDFKGGYPRELVQAIQNASGKPLNAIIPREYADTELPPLKMSNVTVPQLFEALRKASLKSVAYVTGTMQGPSGPQHSYSTFISSYGFYAGEQTATGFTQGGRRGGGFGSDIEPDPTGDSIWYFRVEQPPGPPLTPLRTCRFYRLTPYIDSGLTVDDITTAIQTGWKMLGEKDTPEISFHKDTQLLIAVGEPSKLETIDAVLNALGRPSAGPGLAPPPLRPPVQPEPPRAIPGRSLRLPDQPEPIRQPAPAGPPAVNPDE